MLQLVHQKKGAPPASSIYCRWIRDTRREGAPLIAVWMDSEMRGFEREFALYSDGEVLPETLEEPGGTKWFVWAVPQRNQTNRSQYS